MKPNMLRTIAVLTMFTASGLAVGGCQTDTPFGPLEISSTPPNFRYMPPETIRSAMWVLAAEVEELERLLNSSPPSDSPVLSGAVIGTLDRMRAAAESLEQDGRSTQHPVLNRNLDLFIGRLKRAKRTAERTPPNYFLASSIAGSCFVCHGNNTDTVSLDRGGMSMRR